LAALWGIIGGNLILTVELHEKLMESKLMDGETEKSKLCESIRLLLNHQNLQKQTHMSTKHTKKYIYIYKYKSLSGGLFQQTNTSLCTGRQI